MQTIIAWFFLLYVSCIHIADVVVHNRLRRIIAFRFLPNTVVTKPVAAAWKPFIHEPWFKLSRPVRFAIGWLGLLGIILGSTFGFPLARVSSHFIPCIISFFH